MNKSDLEGRNVKGIQSLKKYLEGERLTQRQSILAKCADCMNAYLDGRLNCEISECPLYPYMPFHKVIAHT